MRHSVPEPRDTPLPRRRRARTSRRRHDERSQRERLIDAMITAAGDAGYKSVSVEQVTSTAGISKATFYQLFADKEDCMVAAYRASFSRFIEPMAALAAGRDLPDAVSAALEQLLNAVHQQPDAARVIFVESLGGGPPLREERRRVALEIAARTRAQIEQRRADGEVHLDVPTVALVGGVRNIVSRHLHNRAEDRLPPLADDLARWVLSYATAPRSERWSSSEDALLPASGRTLSTGDCRAPLQRLPPLPRGRHRLPATVVARSHRTRLIYGTADVMFAKGYTRATVSDIVAAAGVSREVFYEHFKDKEHAFLEAQRHPSHYVLDTCAAAYFSGDSWPERVWRYLGALLDLIVENPPLAHLRLVECYAAGADAIRSGEEITRSFTLFLDEGFRYRPPAAELPRLWPHAITGAIYEIIQRHVAAGEYARLQRQLPRLTYLVLAPFTGADNAIELVREQCAQQSAMEPA